MLSNAMPRVDSATARGIFNWGAPRRRELWRPWPGEEEHLQLAQLQHDGGHPNGKVQAVLPAINQPPAACEVVHLCYICIFFRYKSSVCDLVWLGASTAAAADQKVHDLSI